MPYLYVARLQIANEPYTLTAPSAKKLAQSLNDLVFDDHLDWFNTITHQNENRCAMCPMKPARVKTLLEPERYTSCNRAWVENYGITVERQTLPRRKVA